MGHPLYFITAKQSITSHFWASHLVIKRAELQASSLKLWKAHQEQVELQLQRAWKTKAPSQMARFRRSRSRSLSRRRRRRRRGGKGGRRRRRRRHGRRKGRKRKTNFERNFKTFWTLISCNSRFRDEIWPNFFSTLIRSQAWSQKEKRERQERLSSIFMIPPSCTPDTAGLFWESSKKWKMKTFWREHPGWLPLETKEAETIWTIPPVNKHWHFIFVS